MSLEHFIKCSEEMKERYRKISKNYNNDFSLSKIGNSYFFMFGTQKDLSQIATGITIEEAIINAIKIIAKP